MQRSDDFVGVNRRQNESGVLRGGTFFLGNHLLKVVVITVRTDHFLWLRSMNTTTSCGYF
jgi:hypothetical protein